MALTDFAQGSQHWVGLIAESEGGTIPTSPAFICLPYATCNLALKRATLRDENIKGDRIAGSTRLGTYNVEGDIGGKLVFCPATDALLQGLMGGTWAVAYNLTAQTIAIDKDVKTLTRGSGDWESDGVQIGDTLALGGCTTGANDGNYLISDVDTLALTYSQGPATTNEAGSGSQTVTTTRQIVKMGTTKHYMSIMRKFADITQYNVYAGCLAGKFSLKMAPEATVEYTFSIVGVSMLASEPGSTTYGAAPTVGAMDTFSAAALEAGSPIALLTGIDLDLDNGVKPKFVIGSKTAANVLWGRSMASGKATLLLTDMTMLNKFINETPSSLKVTMADIDGNEYRVLMNNVVYTSGDNAVSNEEDIPLEMGFNADHDLTYTNMQWERVPVYAAA